ncbi:peptide-methionine (R)-S-oxide reductase MsrB [Corynebacterium cystitidis]|uniref:peptide-methionine (R)-S-oxide reductase n=1 Tax=Corynebacterium cystitidis DSM 20524 TaxID=1121357 RepID=A0A1H9PAJ4_9CORY|nr:peptide-methionine (R)-S-oxide reductase MsrB [Corynebacterium cystitidis]WJY82562.1 Peptide methionine sulfoxide reductase MsrB [Corynebacterium cystitidis DSM 20524]SER45284.1 peptide-methionine (R)-S-oxide reductase [Corynebacterium cystitidis DSM 20524]SNV73394.1 peptide methionine sulfoxide reductase [Corynebacterium cystitidis]
MTNYLDWSDQQWRDKLNEREYFVLREAGTEPPGVGEYTDTTAEGVYYCRGCGEEIFRSNTKFDARCGWPAFYQPSDSDKVIERKDTTHGMVRTEVLCANCHSHLGHVFEGEGFPTPTDLRYCINSISMTFEPQSG